MHLLRYIFVIVTLTATAQMPFTALNCNCPPATSTNCPVSIWVTNGGSANAMGNYVYAGIEPDFLVDYWLRTNESWPIYTFAIFQAGSTPNSQWEINSNDIGGGFQFAFYDTTNQIPEALFSYPTNSPLSSIRNASAGAALPNPQFFFLDAKSNIINGQFTGQFCPPF